MIQKPKGTVDYYEDYGYNLSFLISYLNSFMSVYNYNYIKTPSFEVSELFYRGVGETTDIVNKETYDFKDKGNREMTLRPEVTAGVVRSYIENKMYAEGLLKKFYYIGSCFRYERPQSGRFREFMQFGVEAFGSKNACMDAEVISIAYRFLSNIGLDNLVVKLNTLGDKESREAYREALVKHFEGGIDSLCDTCKERYLKNPLRILDCKVDSENDLIKNAPKTVDYLNEESKKFYEDLKSCLDDLDIPYEEDSRLVRGLDYYTHTVFEIVSDLKELGPASTICGGGRYDNLVETLGGPSTPGVGFALGLDRLLKIIENEEIRIDKPKIDAYILNMSETNDAFMIADELRSEGFVIELDYLGKNMKGQFKQVDKFNPSYVIIVGEDEVKGDYVTIKDNLTKESEKVKRINLIDFFKYRV